MTSPLPWPAGNAPKGGRVLALCGGVGGAKLALGLQGALDEGALTVVVNTGDDFEFLGLSISPDLDSVLYALAGMSDSVRGWGRADETWNFMSALKELGEETWFMLGDRDLATHVERTRRLRAGESLGTVMADMALRLGVTAELVPMTEAPVRTIVHTNQGDLPFQHYFVKHRCEPVVRSISFAGSEEAVPHPALTRALQDPQLSAVVICPSNPYLSVDPILAVPGVRAALKRAVAPVIAVSPIVGGQAVKGPTVSIMNALGVQVNSAAIAAHYAGLLDGLVIDSSDRADAESLALPVLVTPTLMRSTQDKETLARAVLAFAGTPSPIASAVARSKGGRR